MHDHHLHFTDPCRRLRAQMNSSSSLAHSTLNDNHQMNQRIETLKRQHQAQRGELAVYKRELAQLRATQQRQKDKFTDMERRLNEHEQRFDDILAQLRNGSLIATNSGAIIGTDLSKSKAVAGAGVGKRKRVAQTTTGT